MIIEGGKTTTNPEEARGKAISSVMTTGTAGAEEEQVQE
jgi:hypothetical protein